MTNLGMEQALAEQGHSLVRANVGDRYVLGGDGDRGLVTGWGGLRAHYLWRPSDHWRWHYCRLAGYGGDERLGESPADAKKRHAQIPQDAHQCAVLAGFALDSMCAALLRESASRELCWQAGDVWCCVPSGTEP